MDLKDILMSRCLSGGGSSGGAVSWNDLKNKPFGEIKGDTLSWTIDFESYEDEDFVGGFLAKVSDAKVRMSDLSDGGVLDLSGIGIGVLPFTADDITDTGLGVIVFPDMMVVFVDDPGVGVDVEGLVFPESGVYVVIDVVSGSITIPGYQGFVDLKKIDEKYLPITATKTVVLYVFNDGIYKDAEHTEQITSNELFSLIRQYPNFVLHLHDNEIAVPVRVHSSHVLYLSTTGNVFKAYTADYTP